RGRGWRRPGSTPSASCLASLAAGLASLFWGKLVRGATGVGRLTALASGNTGLFGREFMGTALRMGRFAAFTRDLTAILRIHGREAASALTGHDATPLRVGLNGHKVSPISGGPARTHDPTLTPADTRRPLELMQRQCQMVQCGLFTR